MLACEDGVENHLSGRDSQWMASQRASRSCLRPGYIASRMGLRIEGDARPIFPRGQPNVGLLAFLSLNCFLPRTTVIWNLAVSLQGGSNVSLFQIFSQPTKDSAQEALTRASPLHVLCVLGRNFCVTVRQLSTPKSRRVVVATVSFHQQPFCFLLFPADRGRLKILSKSFKLFSHLGNHRTGSHCIVVWVRSVSGRWTDNTFGGSYNEDRLAGPTLYSGPEPAVEQAPKLGGLRGCLLRCRRSLEPQTQGLSALPGPSLPGSHWSRHRLALASILTEDIQQGRKLLILLSLLSLSSTSQRWKREEGH